MGALFGCNIAMCRASAVTSLRLRIIKRSCGVVIAKLPGLAVIFAKFADGLPRQFDLWVQFYPGFDLASRQEPVGVQRCFWACIA
jgi:hypothetical protein